MKYLPINIDISDKKILLVGGGRIALHKLDTLLDFTAAENIHIISLEVCDKVRNTPGLVWTERAYQQKDLEGYTLVYACTNDRALNKQIKEHGQAANILVNVVDTPALCDFVSPAIYQHPDFIVAVSSHGRDVYKSIAIRDEVRALYDKSN